MNLKWFVGISNFGGQNLKKVLEEREQQAALAKVWKTFEGKENESVLKIQQISAFWVSQNFSDFNFKSVKNNQLFQLAEKRGDFSEIGEIRNLGSKSFERGFQIQVPNNPKWVLPGKNFRVKRMNEKNQIYKDLWWEHFSIWNNALL